MTLYFISRLHLGTDQYLLRQLVAYNARMAARVSDRPAERIRERSLSMS